MMHSVATCVPAARPAGLMVAVRMFALELGLIMPLPGVALSQGTLRHGLENCTVSIAIRLPLLPLGPLFGTW